MSFSMDDAAYAEANRGLGLVVRIDNARPAGYPPWTVAIQGVDRGDANNPHDAASKLRERLLDLVRDAEEGRLARARLEKAREALAAYMKPGPSLGEPGGVAAAEAAGSALRDLRAALEDRP